jgi:hypothetical protein
MLPQSPVIEGHQDREMKLGEGQSQYMTLPALVCHDEKGTVITKWQLEDFEREEVARSGVIWLQQLTLGHKFQAMLPFAFEPEVPPAVAPVEVAERLIVEFRIVPLDRSTGAQLTSIEAAAKTYADIFTLSQAMNCVTPPLSQDPDEQVRYTVDLHARLLSEMYGADVYFRPMGCRDGHWLLREGARPDRKASSETIHLEGVIDVLLIDDGSASVGEAIAMMKGLRERFESPFYLAGYSMIETYDRIQPLGEQLATHQCGTLDEVMAFFRSALRPRGNYCVMVKAAQSASESGEEGSFLLDTRIYDKSKSN